MFRRTPRLLRPGQVALALTVAVQAIVAPGQVAAQASTPARRVGASSAAAQQAPTSPMVVDTSLFSALRWREVGPARGGRSVAVAGSAQRPLEYWMGSTGGGVFKTTDGGMNWSAVTDKYFGGTVGAIAVDHLNPDIVWSGGGETDIQIGRASCRERVCLAV